MSTSDESPDGADKIQQFAKATLRSALWSLGYHEKGLMRVRRKLPLVRGLLEQAAIDVSDGDLEDAGEPDDAGTVDQLAAALLGSALESVRFHEESLIAAAQNVAVVKVLIARVGCDVDAQQVEQEVRARLAEREG